MSTSTTLILLVMGQLATAPTLTLDDALRAAQTGNHDLQAAQARLAQARQVTRKAWSGYLPQISVGASYTRNNAEAVLQLPTGYYVRDIGTTDHNGPAFDPSRPPSPENPPGAPSSQVLVPSGFAEAAIQKYDQLGAQLQVNQALIVPALWPAIQTAYAVERTAELGVEAARREVLFGVAQLYYAAVGLREVAAVQQRLLENQKAHESDAQVRFASGTVPQMSVVRAQIDRARFENDLERAQNAYELAKVSLATLIGRKEPFEVERPAAPQLPADLLGLEQGAAERPDVLAARGGVDIARGQERATVLKYAPNLFLTGTYRLANIQGFTGSYDSWSVGVALSWSLWDGGLREAELRESAAKLAEAEATLRGAEARAAGELRQAALELASARAARARAEAQRKLARENMRLVEVNYRTGTITQLDVSDANSALVGAELGLVAESLNADLAALKLLKAAGAFNPN